jgi:pre-mRNA-splicing factor RBM22/SLT11
MQKFPYGGECKVCKKPYTVFRWKADVDSRYKKTQICSSCAKLKNVCQICILDLQYNLPVAVVDRVASSSADQPSSNFPLPTSDKDRAFLARQAQTQQEAADLLAGGSSGRAGRDNKGLQALSRDRPYYERNKAHVCGYWLKGTCNRGNTCPFRHEDPQSGDPSHRNNGTTVSQDVVTRYYGRSDKSAEKILSQAQRSGTYSELPHDRSITTLCIADVDTSAITEDSLRNHFSQFGTLSRVKVLDEKKMAFVQYADRSSAENAAAQAIGVTEIGGHSVRVGWARPKSSQPVRSQKVQTKESDR